LQAFCAGLTALPRAFELAARPHRATQGSSEVVLPGSHTAPRKTVVNGSARLWAARRLPMTSGTDLGARIA
jgi:hypothetical protein